MQTRNRTLEELINMNQTAERTYVVCPKCGDPLVGPFPRPGEFLECTNCHDTFPFDDQALQCGTVQYDNQTQRWSLRAIHDGDKGE